SPLSNSMDQLRQHPDILQQMRAAADSYPKNHHPNEAANVDKFRHKVKRPTDWFKRPSSNPLIDDLYFPTFDRLPMDDDYDEDFYEGNFYRKFWVLLAEISDASHAGISFLRNAVTARDRRGREFRIFFYPDSDSGQFDYRSLRKGSTMVMFCPVQHQFLDGQIGLRMEQLETVRVLHMPLSAVRRTAALVHGCSVHKCWQCQSARQQRQSLYRCTGCGYARYCSRDCQLSDLARHKAECASGGRLLRQIARLVYFRYDSAVSQQRFDDVYVSHPFDLHS
ncbi:hypothetical protein BOX15_Mlig017090g1, partial [Macrostomum lignano]